MKVLATPGPVSRMFFDTYSLVSLVSNIHELLLFMNLIIIGFEIFLVASGPFNIVPCVNHFCLLQSSLRTLTPCPSALRFL